MELSTYYELLRDYISFKTIHNTLTFASEAEKTVKWFAGIFAKYQFETREYSVDDTPILVAKYLRNKNLPTGLIYTHYDLSLQEITTEWKNNPFNLYLGKEKIIGRGVAEHKGQFILYLTTILELIANGKLGYNVIFLIDGTQNNVGATLSEFLEQHKEELQADFCCCSVGSGVADKPTLEVGQRGRMNFDLVLTTEGERGTSGLNTPLEMSKLLTKLYNLNKIAIPYFYCNVEMTKPEAEIKRYGTNLEYRTITKSVKPNHTILEPTLEITGVISLPRFEKSLLAPRKTLANLQMYLVPNQHFQEVINGLQQWLKMVIPPQLKTELVIHEVVNPCKFNIQSVFVQKAMVLLAQAFKFPIEQQQKETCLKTLALLQTLLCPNIVALPFATQSSNIGGANENLQIDHVKKCLEFCFAFFGG